MGRAAFVALLAACLLAACGPAPGVAPGAAVPGSLLLRGEVVARAERRLSPPGRGPVLAKLTTWRALAPVVALRRGSHSEDLTAEPDRWLWALLIDTGGDPTRAGTVIAADATTGEWLGSFGPAGDPKGLRAREQERLARARWDSLPDLSGAR